MELKNGSRIGKLIIHYELFKMINGLPGDIVECGIFKGMSLIRFATFRNLFKMQNKKKILGFDAFGKFPEAKFEQDKKLRKALGVWTVPLTLVIKNNKIVYRQIGYSNGAEKKLYQAIKKYSVNKKYASL